MLNVVDNVILNDGNCLEVTDLREANPSAVYDYLNAASYGLEQETQDIIGEGVDPWAVDSKKGCTDKLCRELFLLLGSIPLGLSYAWQSYEFARSHLDNAPAAVPAIASNVTNNAESGIFDVSHDSTGYQLLNELKYEAIVASTLINIMQVRLWSDVKVLSRYTRGLVAISFLWAIPAGFPLVAGTKEAMENLNLGSDAGRWLMMISVTVANSIMFIKPVSEVIRRLANCCLSLDRTRDWFYTSAGFCQDGVDKVIEELDKSRGALSDLDIEVKKIAYLRSVVKSVTNGRNNHNLNGLEGSLLRVLPTFKVKIDLLLALAGVTACFYSYGTLPDIESVFKSFSADDTDCSNRLKTLAYLPAAIPNLFYDSISQYLAWTGIWSMGKDLCSDPTAKSAFGLVGCLLIAIFTAPPSMLQAGLCTAFMPWEKIAYPLVAGFDAVSVNFVGLTADDVDLAAFVFQFAASCLVIEALKGVYDDVMLESVGMLIAMHVLIISQPLLSSCYKNMCKSNDARPVQASVNGCDDIGALGVGLIPGSNLSEQDKFKKVKELRSEMQKKVVTDPAGAARVYYQNSVTWFEPVINEWRLEDLGVMNRANAAGFEPDLNLN